MLLPNTYTNHLEIALPTQSSRSNASQPLHSLNTALKKLSRGINEAFSAAPAAKLEQQTTAVAASTAKAAKAQLKLAAGTAKAAKAARRSIAEFDKLDRLQAAVEESASTASARKSSTKTAQDALPETSPLQAQMQDLTATLQSILAPAAALWEAFWQQLKSTAAAVWQELWSGIQIAWEEYGGPITQGAALAITNLQNIFTALWQNVLQPILTNLMQVLSDLWSAHLKPLWDDVVLLTMGIANCLLELWNSVLAPVVQWLIATFGPAFAEVFRAVSGAVGIAAGLIADAIDLVVTVFRGVITFMDAVFRDDWDAAWQAIGDTVTKVWDKIQGTIKDAINGIVGFINGMISAIVSGINFVGNALSGLSFDVPDWIPGLGGKSFGFSFSSITAPQIPYLAQGAVIPANREFLAVLGDQHSGTNVEAPLDVIKQAVAEVMEDLQAGQMAGFEAVVGVLREILSAVYGIELTDEDVGRAVQRWQRKQEIATGGA